MSDWVPVTEFPNYEINLEGDHEYKAGAVRNRLTGYVLQAYGGKDFENVKSVFMWRAGIRECRSVVELLRTAHGLYKKPF